MASKKIFFICVICFLISVISASAEESLTITTYYPSPYGSYRELRTNMLGVGSTTLMPSVDGEIAARNVLISTASSNMPAGVTY